MLIGHIDGATCILGAPKDWNAERDGACGGLPVRREIEAGCPVWVSAWIPTPDELAALANGAQVNLYVWGVQHPPVAVTVAAA